MVRPSSVSLPPVILVLDVGVLVTGSQREWQQYPSVGTCVLPQAVVDEMQFLLMHAPDSDLERVAREFNRFQVGQKWQSTELLATHPMLKAQDGHALSKKARLSLAVAKCAYGLAKRYPSRLVVLATNEQPQIQRLQMLQMPNLCGITGVGLRGWSQSGQRPIAVLQHWQQMKAMGIDDPSQNLVVGTRGRADDINPNSGLSLHNGLSRSPARPAAATVSPSRRTSPATQVPRSTPSRSTASRKSRPNRPNRSKSLSNRPDFISQIISLVGTVIVLWVVGWLAWQLFNPAQLSNFWEEGSPTEVVD